MVLICNLIEISIEFKLKTKIKNLLNKIKSGGEIEAMTMTNNDERDDTG